MDLAAILEHPDVVRLARSLAVRGAAIETVANARHAAIALILRGGSASGLEVLLIKRAEFEGDPWSGHIACPGGRAEADDPDLAATAMRETLEETGIDLARDGVILGRLDDVTPRTPFLPPIIISPFVAAIRRDVTLTLSDEVATAFWVGLDALRDASAWGRGMVRVRDADREVAVFRYDDHTVWGLTERVLSQFLHRLDGRDDPTDDSA